jgi:hypothetical protein
MTLEQVKTLTELGSFGLVVCFVIGVGLVVRRVVLGLERAASRLDETFKDLSNALAKMSVDNAAHYARDDILQEQLVKDLEVIARTSIESHSRTHALLERCPLAKEGA